ncbi:MAG: trypsin-like peptidase domain-containing protein, partial [Acidobacteria bacterium]|nr:trypsin-like peptidase domain-containing protein [Acidobacteriota bacterium]
SRGLGLLARTVVFLTVPETRRNGSGVVIHAAGYILTNAHVVMDARTVLVGFSDGSEFEAEVYGVDTATDLAVVKVKDGGLTAAALGDSDQMQVGEFVLALGAPFGLQATATSGIVSGLHRSGLGIARYEDFIVTDAPINRGNSGGPLVSLRGEVIGINTAIITGEDGGRGDGNFSGVGFAIPINVARAVAQRLIGDGGLTLPDETTGDVDRDGTASVSGDAVPRRVARDPVFGVADLAAAGSPRAGMSRSRQRPLQADAVATQRPAPSDAVATLRSLDDEGNTLANGSGFVFTSDFGPLLLTNEHVVMGADVVQIFLGETVFLAAVLSADATRDLALLRIPDAVAAPALRLGDSHSISIGDRITALGGGSVDGDPSNEGTVTRADAEVPGISLAGTLIETTAPIEPGDSGGPLLDDRGFVVGVLVARASEAVDLGEQRHSYAIPLHNHTEVIALIHASQGAECDPGFEGAAIPGRGFMISLGDSDGVAGRAGLRHGDVIVAVNGESIADLDNALAWYDAFVRSPAAAKITIQIERDDLVLELVGPCESEVP